MSCVYQLLLFHVEVETLDLAVNQLQVLLLQKFQ